MVDKKEVCACMFCGKNIHLFDEKFVLLGTYNGNNILDESYFHFDCFRCWHNKKTSERAENVVKTAGESLMGILGGKLNFNLDGDKNEEQKLEVIN